MNAMSTRVLPLSFGLRRARRIPFSSSVIPANAGIHFASRWIMKPGSGSTSFAVEEASRRNDGVASRQASS